MDQNENPRRNQNMGGLSTAGAVPVRNEKGELSMQKVKVQRYISGRKPEFDQNENDSSDSEDGQFTQASYANSKMIIDVSSAQETRPVEIPQQVIESDRRLRRLQRINEDPDNATRNGRRIDGPEIIRSSTSAPKRERMNSESSEDHEEAGSEDDEIERRHARLRARREEMGSDESANEETNEIQGGLPAEEEDEDADDDEEESDEYDSESDDGGPRLKPMFISKNDRMTLVENERLEKERIAAENHNRRLEEARREETIRMLEDIRRREEEEKDDPSDVTEEQMNKMIAACVTDDEDEQTAYAAWKVRELERIKRDREEREALAREKEEAEKLHNMTESERQRYFEDNPKLVTNQAEKGKMNFLQKYFHRGAFFLDEDNELLKRDFAQPTLLDRTDKTKLPQVTQVKNFGRSGQTKYTHLKDQDTTAMDSPWAAPKLTGSKQIDKFYASGRVAGMKQSFERPSGRKRR